MAHKTTVMVSSSIKTVAMVTVLTSILWTTYGIYSALKKPVSLDIPAAILAPVNPTIDMDTIEKIKNRRQITDEVSTDALVQQALAILQREPTVEAATVSANLPTNSLEENAITTPSAQASPAPSL